MSFQQVFIYEFVTGGGLFHWQAGSLDSSLATEGMAMLRSIAMDFLRLSDVRVIVMRDSRLQFDLPEEIAVQPIEDATQESAQYTRLIDRSDYVLVIAPELDDWLARKTASVPASKLLSPHLDFVQACSNKRDCHFLLQAARVPVPEILDAGQSAGSPEQSYLVKPIDGAGSQGIRRLHSRDEKDNEQTSRAFRDGTVIVQEECEGRAASIAAIGNGDGYQWLPACWQHIQDDFCYRGGSLITDTHDQRRASRLGQRALAALPQTQGYVGIDLILGPSLDGKDDRVIEINPRLTTSYIGLRAATDDNLAEAMLPAVPNERTRIAFRSNPVEFQASGEVQVKPARGHEHRQGA